MPDPGYTPLHPPARQKMAEAGYNDCEQDETLQAADALATAGASWQDAFTLIMEYGPTVLELFKKITSLFKQRPA